MASSTVKVEIAEWGTFISPFIIRGDRIQKVKKRGKCMEHGGKRSQRGVSSFRF